MQHYFMKIKMWGNMSLWCPPPPTLEMEWATWLPYFVSWPKPWWPRGWHTVMNCKPLSWRYGRVIFLCIAEYQFDTCDNQSRSCINWIIYSLEIKMSLIFTLVLNCLMEWKCIPVMQYEMQHKWPEVRL